MRGNARRAAALVAAPVVALTLVGSSCARSVTLGYEEAIEVMVLDGVDRSRATCIVSVLDGQLALAKVTGLETGLEEDELALLAATSAGCAPALAAPGGVVGGPSLNDPTIVAEQAALEAGLDVEAAVYRMVDEGLDPTLAECLIVELSIFPEPTEIFEDDARFSGLVVDCREQVG